MLIGGGVIIKVFLISPAHLVRLRTLSGFAACPGAHASPRATSACATCPGTHASPRAISVCTPDPCTLPIQNVVMSSFARPSLILRSPFARPSLILRSIILNKNFQTLPFTFSS